MSIARYEKVPGMGPRIATRVFGGGESLYEVDTVWPQIREGWSFREVAGVATDSHDRGYVFNRGERSVMGRGHDRHRVLGTGFLRRIT